MNNIFIENDNASRKSRTQLSYQTALGQYRRVRGLARISWFTWIITIVTSAVWCFTAYQVALAAGAHSFHDIIANVMNNAVNVQDNDALSRVLITYGAKDNDLIIQGQYWRFITPIFLHANLLHVGLNMFNFFVLGIFLERLVGHLRFLLIYLLTGVISIIASFYFMPQEISVGASGAIFGLVGAYSVFVLTHRRAFRNNGYPALLWLVLIIGVNLSIGLFIPNVDNYAHLGGLLSGCLLGWWFMPLYTLSPNKALIDVHSLSRRWPLALLTIVGTLILAILARYLIGG
ncbi:MAG: rhomboid family intramembrane serine protease [Ktedonobacteraceae bacterium]